MTQAPTDRQARQRRTMWLLAVLAVGMFGLGFALVPLYGLFCSAIGIPRNAETTSSGVIVGIPVAPRWVTVKFDGAVQPNLPWDFQPPEPRTLNVRLGETYEVRFTAVNRSNRRVTGQAIPSIVPWQATNFFHKLECFCFQQQTLEGNQRVEMPLRFTVSPDLPKDIDAVMLMYNFMRIEAGPDAQVER
ncbi:cytochrome c oxidase assembly protein subunit 11 [Gammaproteobacteria bacterium]